LARRAANAKEANELVVLAIRIEDATVIAVTVTGSPGLTVTVTITIAVTAALAAGRSAITVAIAVTAGLAAGRIAIAADVAAHRITGPIFGDGFAVQSKNEVAPK
jgi:hypothetical protein